MLTNFAFVLWMQGQVACCKLYVVHLMLVLVCSYLARWLVLALALEQVRPLRRNNRLYAAFERYADFLERQFNGLQASHGPRARRQPRGPTPAATHKPRGSGEPDGARPVPDNPPPRGRGRATGRASGAWPRPYANHFVSIRSVEKRTSTAVNVANARARPAKKHQKSRRLS